MTKTTKSAKTPHAADLADIEIAKTAISYNVHLRRSPTSKINEPTATLAEAIAIYDRMVGEYSGRSPLIYGITPSGSTVLIPKVLITAARQEAEAGDFEASVPAFLKDSRPALSDMAAAVEAGEQIETPAPAPAPKAKRGKNAAAPAAEQPMRMKQPRAASGKRAEIEAAARAGTLPAAPDFSADTHKPFRKKLEALTAMIEAGDIDGLRAFAINPISSSPKALDRYRNLAVIALEARAEQKAAA